ncbi:MAG: hypothetical protein Q8K89_04265 [Actinomycetota bacterium]|nr:hypothetical protein [Actinomycetota bacterium]
MATRGFMFSPFNFQAPLAAGGVTLMAFNWLQFAVPHGEGAVRLSDIQWSGLTLSQAGLYGLLVGMTLVLTLVNVLLTVIFSKDLVHWIAAGKGYPEFMAGPPSRTTGIFVPIASLAMTMAVVFAVAPFFIPAVSANMQSLMMPGLVFFGMLWLTMLGLEFRILARSLRNPPDPATLSFVWLLDVFAFGLVSLAGTGLAAMAAQQGIATAAALTSGLALGVGTLLLVGKLAILILAQVRSRTLPEYQVQPAFFLVVPITCLYGVSYFRLMLFGQKWFELEVNAPSQFLISLTYVIAIGWALGTVYLLRDYFKNYFRASEYFPTQWAMV